MAGFDIKNDHSKNALDWLYRVIKTLKTKSNKKHQKNKIYASSNSLYLGCKGNIRSRSLIQNQVSFLPPSIKKSIITNEEDPFTKFLNLFTKLHKIEPTLDIYVKILNKIKEHDANCPQIVNPNSIEPYEKWIDDHFLEYEPLIFSILNDLIE